MGEDSTNSHFVARMIDNAMCRGEIMRFPKGEEVLSVDDNYSDVFIYFKNSSSNKNCLV